MPKYNPHAEYEKEQKAQKMKAIADENRIAKQKKYQRMDSTPFMAEHQQNLKNKIGLK